MIQLLDSEVRRLAVWCSWGLLASGVLTLLVRMAAGASPRALWRSRGYEIPQLRAALQVVKLALVAGGGLLVVAGGHRLFAMKELGWQADIARDGSIALVGGLVVWGLAAWWASRVVAIADNTPPVPSTAAAVLRDRIRRDRLAEFGYERFPNDLTPHWRDALGARGWLATFSLAVLAAGVFGSLEGQLDAAWRLWVLARAHELKNACEVPRAVAMAACYAAAVVLLVLVANNRSYTLLTFPHTVCLQGLAVGTLLVAGLHSGLPTSQALWLPIGALALLAFRWLGDLGRSRQWRAYDAFLEPMRRAVLDDKASLHLARDLWDQSIPTTVRPGSDADERETAWELTWRHLPWRVVGEPARLQLWVRGGWEDAKAGVFYQPTGPVGLSCRRPQRARSSCGTARRRRCSPAWSA